MLKISHESPKWYRKQRNATLTQTMKDNIRQNIETETYSEFASQLSSVNWWQKNMLRIKLWDLIDQRTELAIQHYLRTQNLPPASDESLW